MGARPSISSESASNCVALLNNLDNIKGRETKPVSSRPVPEGEPIMGPDPDTIPIGETAQAVADVIGREDTLKIARTIKHPHFYVPAKIPAHHWLSKLIGPEKCERMIAEFRGLVLDLGKCKPIEMAIRNRRIIKAYIDGQPTGQIAHHENIAISVVCDVVRPYRKSGTQGHAAARNQRPVRGAPGGGIGSP